MSQYKGNLFLFYFILFYILFYINFSGNWRSNKTSSNISNCYNLETNCELSDIISSSNDLCYLGHYGGFCEACDLYNHRL